MKRTKLAALFLPLSMTLFFSCKSTEGAAQKAQESSPAVETESEAEAANDSLEQSGADIAEAEDAGQETAADASALEEKIPQSEFDEFRELLEDEQGQEGGLAKSKDGSLAEKIKNSNGTQADAAASSEADGAGQTSGAAQAQDAEEKSGRGQNTSVAVAPAQSKPAAQDDGEGLSRVTSQGNTIQNGPLVGPGSDKTPGSGSSGLSGTSASGRDATTGLGAATGAAAAVAGSGAQEAANEAIALTAPQKNEDEVPQEEEKPEPVPSRAMTIKNNQFVDIVYPGSGWIYLGEEGAGDHFIFQGRKLGNGETTFSLRSKQPGVALLHFYKNDILTGNYIDDYIEISITEKSAADAIHVTAPSYAEVVPPKFDRSKAVEEKASAQEKPAESSQKPAEKVASQKSGAALEPSKDEPRAAQSESAPSEKVQTVIQTSGQEKAESKQKTSVAGTKAAPSSQAQDGAQKDSGQGALQGSAKAASLLERAQKAYDEKRYSEALDLVQQFFDSATEDIDAGLYLEGLILEAKSEVRNIKSAIGAYDTLIKNWPQSRFWRRANERSIYLKRFYIDIR